MIVVVTGGRDFADYPVLKAALDALHFCEPITLIRNGGMNGADALSSYWAYERKVDTQCYGAKWGESGNAAGPIRNRVMLMADPRPTVVVALPGGRGTENTVRLAEGLGIKVHVVAP